ncbi:MAG TPA: hypothetical protein VN577_05210 [Terriglobales bacterium]|nr:hypothetical protein [Terriglobales bacterium]
MTNRLLQFAGVFLLFAGLTACGGISANLQTAAASSAASSTAERPTLTYSSAHFVFHYTSLDSSNISGTASKLEAEYSRILSDFGTDSMPKVHVTLYPDHRQLELATTALAGYIPSWTAGLVTSPTAIHMMSPNLSEWGGYDIMIGNLLHEFAHCVSLQINGSIANHPRWLWESVAIYEAGQLVPPRRVDYMKAHNPPSFSELNSIDDTRTYQVGFTIVEYVMQEFGKEKLRELIVRNGDTQTVLGVAQSDFERQWFEWVRRKYSI